MFRVSVLFIFYSPPPPPTDLAMLLSMFIYSFSITLYSRAFTLATGQVSPAEPTFHQHRSRVGPLVSAGLVP